jgi:hypothetical protein
MVHFVLLNFQVKCLFQDLLPAICPYQSIQCSTTYSAPKAYGSTVTDGLDVESLISVFFLHCLYAQPTKASVQKA